MMENPKPLESVSVLFMHNEQIFAVQRQPYLLAFPGYQAFPGGKIENKESKEKAAIREVMEETGLSIDPYYLGQVSHQYSHFKVCISLFLANIEDDSCLETKQKYQWVTRKRINDFPLPKANYKMLEILDKLN